MFSCAAWYERDLDELPVALALTSQLGQLI